MSATDLPGRGPTSPGLRIGFVPGVTLTKWTRIWSERFPRAPLELVDLKETEQRAALDEDRVDLCFVRLPLADERSHLIPLYEEVPVVIVSKEHPLSLFEEVTLADLVDENLLDLADGSDSIDLVAGGAGVLLAPHSIARSFSRRDLVFRTVTDAAPTQIALAWRVDHPHELIEDFIGIVRGRTPNSSRSARPESPPSETTKKKPANKAAARIGASRSRGSSRKRPRAGGGR